MCPLRLLLIIIFLYIIFINDNLQENFMNYEQKRRYFDCKYSGNPNSVMCNDFYNDISHIKNHIINNPVGYVYRNRLKRPVGSWYDRDSRQYYYYVIDFSGRHFNRYNDYNNTIIHKIENKGRMLSDGDTVYVPTKGHMKLKLYDRYLSNPTIVYNDSYFSPRMHPQNSIFQSGYSYGYNNNWKTVGYLNKKNKFYKLYELEYPRGNYRYKIEYYPNFYLNVVSDKNASRTEDQYRFRNRLYSGDIVNIDTVKGNYTVKIYDYDDIIL